MSARTSTKLLKKPLRQYSTNPQSATSIVRSKRNGKKRRVILNPKTVLKLMRATNIKYKIRIKKYRSYRGNVASNILSRDFSAEKPNQKWVTDVTEFTFFGEKLYLSPVLDLFNSEIIAYKFKLRPTYELVYQAFEHLALGEKPILHSNQGWHYQMGKYKKALDNRYLTQSMSHKGNCLDHAVIENFFEILTTGYFISRNSMNISFYYNQKRMKSKLKDMIPVKYRIYAQQAD